MTASYDEKRKTNRIPVNMKLIQDGKIDYYGFSYITNISIDGIALESRFEFNPQNTPKVGNVLQMKFKLPGSTVFLDVKGQITRVDITHDHPHIGLKFVEVPPDACSEINKYVLTHEIM